jgi:heme/copper-type cytochrome/quinol oxidase subunit 2
MVYWCLYIFIIDFAAWSNKAYKKNKISNILNNVLNFIFLNILFIIHIFYKYVLKIFKEYIDFKYISKINEYLLIRNNKLNTKKEFNLLVLNNNISYNSIILNQLNKYNIILNYIYLASNNYMYYEYILNKKMNNFLFNNKPKYIYYLASEINTFSERNVNKLVYSNLLNKIRIKNNYVFNLNQFRHSGIFEGVWAFFPTIIILLILIPSLILIYSFEDIINPKMSVKVIGNQWYWTYEMDSWLEYKNNINKTEFNFINNESEEIRYNYNNINEYDVLYKILDNKELLLNNDTYSDILYNNLIKNNWVSFNEKNIKLVYCTFSFDSVIKDLDSLNLGEKRLLEVDNRLILSTNETIRFLITAADVLHSFSVPELGLKVDAVPGRLNQLLSFINRPGIYYGHVQNYVVWIMLLCLLL